MTVPKQEYLNKEQREALLARSVERDEMLKAIVEHGGTIALWAHVRWPEESEKLLSAALAAQKADDGAVAHG